ncbi:MAG: hypothetical protein ABJH82_09810 [Polaribacter sp.]|uniref:tetratricopeptide repeat protein n=1 Tax=Polaribacter sp. TaxID=1920175 RepID=UPI003262F54F
MEDLEFDKNLKKVITIEERKQQKTYLQSVESTIKPKKTNWLIAASIAAIIGLTSYFTLSNNSKSNQELFAENFTPYRNIIVPIVRDKTTYTPKFEAFANYENGSYKKAITLFNKLTAKDSLDTNTLNFYKANAYLQIEKPKEAIKNLLKISDNDKKWQEERLWYLALASLKINAPKDAKKYLTYLKDNNIKEFKIAQIEKLLKQLQ